MKVLLINPKNTAWSSGTSTLPLGLAYIASTLMADNHEVDCVDMQLEPAADVQKMIRAHDIVGITACTPSIKEAWELARLARAENKTVVLGGPHVTALPGESLENGRSDLVVRGEGEITMKELCAGTEPGAIAGLSYRSGGEVFHNPPRPAVRTLDGLAFPAREKFKYKNYRSGFHKKTLVGSILTSRGCPFDCNFCNNLVFGRIYRTRSPENVVEEWALMAAQGFEEISVTDDNFTADPGRVLDICGALTAKGLNLPWTASGGLRVDMVSEEMLSAMKRSGCYRVSLGAESGSQRILDTIGKGIRVQQIRDAVKLSKKAGLETIVFFMVGNPGETSEDVRMTIDLARELSPDFVQVTVAVPYPGTRLYETIKKNGRFIVDDWAEYGSYAGKAYFEYGTINGSFVEKMYKKIYRDYYLRPGVILKLLARYNFRLLKFLKLFY